MFFFLLLSACTQDSPKPDMSTPKNIPIRIGWQTTWATQGQLAVILQQEQILSDLGFDAEFIGFSYGGPLNEGALAGKVDVIFTADQPAIALCARDPSWGIIGRLMYNRVGTFVPPASSIQSPRDLKNTTIAIPFGAAAHRETLYAVQAAGLDPTVDINPVNMAIKEIAVLAQNTTWKEKERWDNIDAASAWDPIFADLESQNLIRTIASGLVTSVVVMDDDFTQKHPEASQKFMNGLQKAYTIYRESPQQSNQRFIESSNLKFSSKALDLAASVEPNLKTENAIQTVLSSKDQENLQKAADFMFDAKLLKSRVQIKDMLRP